MKKILCAAIVLASSVVATTASWAVPMTYHVDMSGPNESPPNASPGTGSATIVVDGVANTLAINMGFTGLTAGTTASHIHCCTASPFSGTAIVATTTPTFTGFPLGVTSATYNNTLDLTVASSYNSAFITAHGGTIAGAEAALIAGIAAGEAYLNVHTSAFPNGEIRGFLVPEPASFVILATGLLALGRMRKRVSGAAQWSASVP